MPECGGIEASHQIRGGNRNAGMNLPVRNPDIPVIALTANATSSSIEECLEAGMNGHVTKPVNLADIKEELNKWLGN